MLGDHSGSFSAIWWKLGIIWKIGDVTCGLPPTFCKNGFINTNECERKVIHTCWQGFFFTQKGWVEVFCLEKVKERLSIHTIKFDPQTSVFYLAIYLFKLFHQWFNYSPTSVACFLYQSMTQHIFHYACLMSHTLSMTISITVCHNCFLF